MARLDFTATVRRLVAERSGFKCSYLGCGRITVGPGPQEIEVSRTGIAAHIYSASQRGPRGWGRLSKAGLTGPGNAIWLCSEHARLIDNNRGAQFPPALLFEYKRIHEARIAREQRGITSPLGWFHRLLIESGPLFVTPASLEFGKVTLITGNNDTGKTAIWQWTAGIGDQTHLKRWLNRFGSNDPVKIQITYFDPTERNVGFCIEPDHRVQFTVANQPVPFQPFNIRFIAPKDPHRIRNWNRMNDLRRLSAVFGLPPTAIAKLVETPLPTDGSIERITLDRRRGKERVIVRFRNTDFDLSLKDISSGELAEVVIEIGIELARFSAEFMPTVLVLDETATSLDESGLRWVVERTVSPDFKFQTIIVIPTRTTDYGQLAQAGAKIVWLRNSPPTVTLT